MTDTPTTTGAPSGASGRLWRELQAANRRQGLMILRLDKALGLARAEIARLRRQLEDREVA